MRVWMLAVVCASLFGFARTGHAADDPAALRVGEFCRALLHSAKGAAAASVQQRTVRLDPLVAEDFNIPVMAQLTVGESWARMSGAEHGAITAALTRYTAARYATEVDSDTGQRCVVEPRVDVRGPDRLVRTKVVDPDGTTAVNYRLRQYGSEWKIIDVFYNGVSELATQRADFAGVVHSQGAAGLVAKLKDLTTKMR
jgi:phospholipid transport system substrate-binding protein